MYYEAPVNNWDKSASDFLSYRGESPSINPVDPPHPKQDQLYLSNMLVKVKKKLEQNFIR